MIYTLGYQNLAPARVREIVLALDAVLLDCRFKPISRIPGFGARQLEALMQPQKGEPKSNQPRYMRMGHLLGGRGHVTAGGIETLQPFDQDVANCVLLCLEEHPIDCHRHGDITGPQFPAALHIWRDRLFFSRDLSRVQAGEIDFPELASGSWNDWLEILAKVKD